MERQPDQANLFEHFKGNILSVLENLIHEAEDHWSPVLGFYSMQKEQAVNELRANRSEPFFGVVTRIVGFLNDSSKGLQKDEVKRRLVGFKQEVFGTQKPIDRVILDAAVDPAVRDLVGKLTQGIGSEVARVCDVYFEKLLGMSLTDVRLKLAKVAELENALKRIRGERNLFREQAGNFKRLLDSMTAAKDSLERRCASLRNQMQPLEDAVRRLTLDKERLQQELRQGGHRGGDTDVVSCVKLEGEVFKSPLSVLGVSAEEVMQIYQQDRDENGFKRKLKRLYSHRIHTDKFEAVKKYIEAIQDTETIPVLMSFLNSRLKRAETALDEIWGQVSRNQGKVEDKWVYKKQP